MENFIKRLNYSVLRPPTKEKMSILLFSFESFSITIVFPWSILSFVVPQQIHGDYWLTFILKYFFLS